MPSQDVGVPIPQNTPHAVSVTLPTWEATVGYEEGEEWVTKKMVSGYPRFFIHSVIQELAENLQSKYGREGERCMVFPSYNVAKRCREFIKAYSQEQVPVRVLQLSTPPPSTEEEKSSIIESTIGIVFFPVNQFAIAKSYWQHSGEGISSRMAEYVLAELFHKDSANSSPRSSRSSFSKQELQARQILHKSPSIRASSLHEESDKEQDTYIEQKYGRVLDLKFEKQARSALRRRICGKVDKSHSQQEEMEKSQRGKNLSETDVYLYPTGMAAIFNAHRALLAVVDEPKISVCFGFPYVDTLNVLRKFGPGVHFLGLGDDESLAQLEQDLESGQKEIMALFCECPSNPLLKTPNLKKIRYLADKFNFAVVVDETVGNFLNVHVLPYADIVASSLTKVFSGDSNVMGGSLILNPSSSWYDKLKKFFNEDYEDLFWAKDALILERNSRDFAERSAKINETTVAAVKLLRASPLIDRLYYPMISDTKKYYDKIKTPNGGYGGLVSFVFKDPADAVAFFNAVNLHKGPSLGTNFTLACPYAILAHYQELDEIAQWDIDRNIIRISVGLEDKDELCSTLKKSLDAAAAQHK
ncbi:hypothetical protein JA9_004274 [Meyerozyma sp. JA9]|nr:hypothetical protein JA9_004274 [Meyerozyma sp. JA9]